MLEHIHRMVWGPWTLAVFLGVGIYFSIRFGFFQVRGFCFWWSATAGSLFKGENNRADTRQGGRRDSEGERAGAVSQLQSVCTALAATVGTGNIAGVATALAAGGAGSALLDVDFRIHRHDYRLWRNGPGDTLPARRWARRLLVRPVCLYRTGTGDARDGASLWFFVL